MGEFAGEYRQKLDSKGRVSVPSDLRVHFSEGDPDHIAQSRGVYLTLNFSPTLQDRRIRLYTQSYMKRISKSVARMKAGSKEQRVAQITLLQKTKQIEVDQDGRIVVPKPLRDQFSIGNEVLFTGSGDYVELWDAQRYDEEEGRMLEGLLSTYGDGFDPISLVDMAGDPELGS